MNKIIKVAIVGYGNVGRGVYEAILRNEDMELAGIITRDPQRVLAEFKKNGLDYTQIVDANNKHDVFNETVDAAILCGGSKNDLPEQGPYFAQFVNTVDSFDTHPDIYDYYNKMNEAAKLNGKVSVISAGWDPGTFSLNRILADAFLPGAKPYGFYGLTERGGVSQGHSDAIRQIPGVLDARQYTHAIPETIERVRNGENPVLDVGDLHWRECYVVIEDGNSEAEIENIIKSMPKYFEPYKTTVEFISQEEMDCEHSSMPHDGVVIAASTTGDGHKAVIEYRNTWESNPEATANILVAHARAAYRLSEKGKSGAFTIADIPPSYFSPHSNEELLKQFM